PGGDDRRRPDRQGRRHQFAHHRSHRRVSRQGLSPPGAPPTRLATGRPPGCPDNTQSARFPGRDATGISRGGSMNRTQARVLLPAALMGGAVTSAPAWAQVTLKPDGQWRHAIGLGLSYASGNSESSTLTLNADGVRQTGYDKWSYYGKALRAESDDETTGDQIGLGTRYERDINGRVFGFGQADYLRDRPANLSRRGSVGGGLGYHVFKTDTLTWDVFGGVGYTHDRYIEPTDVGGATRTTWGYTELLVGEESNHQISDSTTFRQRFVIYPNMSESGEFRAQLDAGLSVAINERMSLTATLTYRYNSDPGAGFEKDDLLLVTGISAKIE